MLQQFKERRATFNKARKGAQRPLNWPLPLTKPKSSTIHPDHLAAAGFHSTPTAEEPTRSTCYLCDSVVESWTEGDDPLARHLELNDRCGWAVLQRLLKEWSPFGGLRDKEEWSEAFGEQREWHPKGERVKIARLASFGVGWPHAGVKGVPTAEEIAEAGWFFSGGAEDNCVCPFCTRTVEGWEAGDEPLALHNRKLGENCPFFDDNTPPARPAPVAKSKGRKAAPAPAPVAQDAPAPPAKLSRSKAQSRLAQQVYEDEQEEEEVVIEEPSQPARASRRTTKNAASAAAPSSDGPETSVVGESLRASSRSTRNNKPASVVSASAPPSVVEEDAQEDEDEPSQSQSQSTRGGGRRAQQQMEVVIELPAKSSKGKGKSARAGKKAAPKVVQEEEEPIEEEPIEEEQEQEDAMEEDDPAPAPVPAKKVSRAKSSAASRSRSTKSKAAVVVAEDAPDEEEQEAGTEMEEAARLANQFLDAEQSIVVEKEVGKKATAASKKVSPPLSVATGGPLTPTVASPSPRPIRSLPSKVNSPSTSAGLKPPSSSRPLPTTHSAPPSLTAPYTAPATLFPSTSSLPPLTPSELALTVGEYYASQSRFVYSTTEAAMKREYELLEARIDSGRRELESMLAAARKREERERRERKAASPRKMR